MIIIKDTIKNIYIGTKEVEHVTIGNTEVYTYIHQMSVPTVKGSYTYNGSEQRVLFNDYPSDKITISGELTATNAGYYTVGFTPKSGYYWDVEGTDARTKYAQWRIQPKDISSATFTDLPEYTYDGTEKKPNPTVIVDNITLELGTNYSLSYVNNINAGTATILVNGVGNYGGQAVASYTIAKLSLQLPIISGSYIYNGNSQSAIISNYNSNWQTIEGTTNSTNQGYFPISIRLKDVLNTQWVNETVEPINGSWSISPLDISTGHVSLSENLIYNGTQQTQHVSSVIVNGLFATFNVSENTATNAGSYTLVCQGTDNFTGEITEIWSIDRLNISGATVVLGRTPTYSGNYVVQTVEYVILDGLNVTFTVDGNTGIQVQAYTLTCTGTNNFTGTVQKQWYIDKANGSVQLSVHSFTFTGSVGEVTSFPFTYVGDGSISVRSSNNSVCAAGLSGDNVTCILLGSGTATITVSMSSGVNYYSAADMCEVTTNIIR